VLAGGASTRMGRDKALLPYRGATLVKYIASVVEQAAGSVALIGDERRYRDLGYPVYADKIPHCGPMGGIYTALSVTATDWNLVVACDMPLLSAAVLERLVERAFKSSADCIVGTASGEPEPLCAAYHRRLLPALEGAIADKRLKMKDLIAEFKFEPMALAEPGALANVNTPADWVRFANLPA